MKSATRDIRGTKAEFATIYQDSDHQRETGYGHGCAHYGPDRCLTGTMDAARLFELADRVFDISAIENLTSKLPFTGPDDCLAKGARELVKA